MTGYEAFLHIYSPAGSSATYIDSSIIDNGGNAVSLTKSGPYTVRLRGSNIITGTLRINEGVVSVQDNTGTVSLIESTTVRDIIINPGQWSAIDIGSRLNTTGTGAVVRIFKNLGGSAFTGSGTLGLSGDVAIGPAIGGVTLTIAPAVDLGTESRTFDISDGTPSVDAALDGPVSGTGGIIKVGRGIITLRAANTYSGPTLLDAGELYVQNAEGTIASNASVTAKSGTRMYLDNTFANNNDRIGESPITLDNAVLKVTGNAASPTIEHCGSISFSQLVMISIDPKAGGVTKLTASSLNRVNKGVIVIAGYSLGSSAAANVAQLALDSPPQLVGSGPSGSPTVGICPLGFGSGRADDWGSRPTGPPDYGSLLTYDPTNGSFRVLNRTTEFVNTPTAAGSDNNVFGSGSITSDKTINSFMSNGHSIGGSAGTTLTIKSGLIFNISGYDPTTLTVPCLTFGKNDVTSCEGIFYTYGFRGSSGRTEVYSVIKDNGADTVSVTIAGQGPTIFRAANTYTGPTTINSGTLRIDSGNDRLPTNTTLDIYANGIFDLNGKTQSIGCLTGSGGTITNSNVSMGTLIINLDSNSTFVGSIVGNLNIIKNGPGILTVTGGQMNCTGALTVNEGGFEYNGANGTGTITAIAVSNGATFSVMGSTILATNVSFGPGSRLGVQVCSTNTGGAGMLNVQGSVTFGEGVRIVTTVLPGFVPSPGASWYVVQAPTISTPPGGCHGFGVRLEPGPPDRLLLRVGSFGTIFFIH